MECSEKSREEVEEFNVTFENKVVLYADGDINAALL